MPQFNGHNKVFLGSVCGNYSKEETNQGRKLCFHIQLQLLFLISLNCKQVGVGPGALLIILLCPSCSIPTYVSIFKPSTYNFYHQTRKTQFLNAFHHLSRNKWNIHWFQKLQLGGTLVPNFTTRWLFYAKLYHQKSE